jgi:hypothetical protein
MFEELFQRPFVIYRHEHAPYREERERYLRHCKDQGYTLLTLVFFARELLWISQKLHIKPQGVTLKQVKSAVHGWAERESRCGQTLNTQWTNRCFIQVARSWLRFLGYWLEPRPLSPFEHLVDSFRLWMEKDRGFTPATIDQACGLTRQFLLWYGTRSVSEHLFRTYFGQQ